MTPNDPTDGSVPKAPAPAGARAAPDAASDDDWDLPTEQARSVPPHLAVTAPLPEFPDSPEGKAQGETVVARPSRRSGERSEPPRDEASTPPPAKAPGEPDLGATVPLPRILDAPRPDPGAASAAKAPDEIDDWSLPTVPDKLSVPAARLRPSAPLENETRSPPAPADTTISPPPTPRADRHGAERTPAPQAGSRLDDTTVSPPPIPTTDPHGVEPTPAPQPSPRFGDTSISPPPIPSTDPRGVEPTAAPQPSPRFGDTSISPPPAQPRGAGPQGALDATRPIGSPPLGPTRSIEVPPPRRLLALRFLVRRLLARRLVALGAVSALLAVVAMVLATTVAAQRAEARQREARQQGERAEQTHQAALQEAAKLLEAGQLDSALRRAHDAQQAMDTPEAQRLVAQCRATLLVRQQLESAEAAATRGEFDLAIAKAEAVAADGTLAAHLRARVKQWAEARDRQIVAEVRAEAQDGHFDRARELLGRGPVAMRFGLLREVNELEVEALAAPEAPR